METKRLSATVTKIVLILLSITIIAPMVYAETFSVDPIHTSIIFRVKHLGVAYVFGRFNGATGTIHFDPSEPGNTSIFIRVKTDNIDTNDEKRDNHLKSPDFFNTAKYPLISFKSNSAKEINKQLLEISGNMTILGKTRPITVKVNHTGAGLDPWGKHRIGFETSFTIKRSDYGMDFMIGGVSDAVNLTVSVEGIKQ